MMLAIFCCFCATQEASAADGSPVKVTGVIRDENGERLPGAGVQIKDTDTGIIADLDGRFTIEIEPGQVLVFSYVGYKDKLVEYKGQKHLDVSMDASFNELDDVVIVAYGAQKKANLTGSVSSVRMDKIETRPVTNLSSALSGLIPGAYVQQSSGQPGADGASISIRGIGSFGSSAPLVLIDGVEGDINSVAVQDVASMSVLKDAASASIYGARAANGVILITTKRGEKSALTINYNGYMGVQEATLLPELLNAVQYFEGRNQAAKNDKLLVIPFSEEYIDNYRNNVDPYLYQDCDWIDILFDPAFMHNHHLNVRGGGDNISVNTSFDYMGQEGIVEGTDYERFSFRNNIDGYMLNRKLHLIFNTFGQYGDRDDLPGGARAAMMNTLKYHPGYGYKFPFTGYTAAMKDYAMMDNGGFNKQKQYLVNAQARAILQMLKHLSLDVSYGIVYNAYNNTAFKPLTDTYYLSTAGEVTKYPGQATTLTINRQEYFTGSFNALLKYSRKYKNAHTLSVMAGTQSYYRAARTQYDYREGFTVDIPYLQYGDPTSAVNKNTFNEISMLSFFGRINYDYKGKYLFEANLRADGSSRFKKSGRWGLFPSVSLGWRITEEPFFKKSTLKNYIQNIKIRASYGQLGNEAVANPYVSYDQLGFVDDATGLPMLFGDTKVISTAVTQWANKDTTWETTEQYNLGLDFTFFKNLNVTMDYFYKNTWDVLMQLPVSPTLGMEKAPFQNAGKILNHGFELSADYYFNVKDWAFNVGGNISHITNKVTDLAGMDSIIPIEANKGYVIIKEGYPINSYIGYEWDGIYQDLDEIKNHLKYTNPDGSQNTPYDGLVPTPGDIKFVDQNGDGIIDRDHDVTVVGKPFPDFIYSFNLGAKWKGIDLSLFFQGVQGVDSYCTNYLAVPFYDGANATTEALKAWTPENHSNTHSRLFTDVGRRSIPTSYYLEDASYLRLKNVELGYSLPSKVLKKVFINKLRIYATVQNAWTWTKYRGFDPEKPSGSIDVTNYPQVRIITFGIDVNF